MDVLQRYTRSNFGGLNLNKKVNLSDLPLTCISCFGAATFLVARDLKQNNTTTEILTPGVSKEFYLSTIQTLEE